MYGSMRRCKGGEGRGNLRQIGETVERATTLLRKTFVQLVRNMPSRCLAKANLELRRLEKRERVDSNKCK